MSLTHRKVLFVLVAAAAGFISGLLVPLVFGVRGAILGAALAIGALVLHPRPGDGLRPAKSLAATLGLSLAVAAAAFAAICLWQLFVPHIQRQDDFGVINLPLTASALTTWSYAATLLLFYRERQAGRRRAWAWFVAAPLLGTALRAWGFHEIAAVPYIFIQGALPFTALWLLAALLADPAWTRKRRQRFFAPSA
jgi:hypothetical protein